MLSYLTQNLQEKKSFKIAFLGTSLTSAEWVHPNWREIVEYVLKEALEEQFTDWRVPSWGIRCINAGFDGANTKDLINLLEKNVIAYEPDLVIVLATSNDIFSEITPGRHKENIKSIINMLVAKNIKVVYCTNICTNNSAYNEKYLPYLNEALSLFPYKGVPAINMLEAFENYPLDKFFTFVSSGNEVVGIKPGELDYIHPNQLGNAYIAKVFLDRIFGISFDPEKYIAENNAGKMFPGYN